MNNEEQILKMLCELAEGQAELKNNQKEIKDHVTRIEDRVTRVEITQETVVIPQIKLLAEGHGAIIDHIKRLDSYPIQEMQDDISVLKSAVRALTQEIAELKAAR